MDHSVAHMAVPSISRLDHHLLGSSVIFLAAHLPSCDKLSRSHGRSISWSLSLSPARSSDRLFNESIGWALDWSVGQLFDHLMGHWID